MPSSLGVLKLLLGTSGDRAVEEGGAQGQGFSPQQITSHSFPSGLPPDIASEGKAWQLEKVEDSSRPLSEELVRNNLEGVSHLPRFTWLAGGKAGVGVHFPDSQCKGFHHTTHTAAVQLD